MTRPATMKNFPPVPPALSLAMPAVVLAVAAGAVLLWGGGATSLDASERAATPRAIRPLRALMFTGGCCHDYEKQKAILSTGISERANVDWEIVHEGGKSTDYEYPLLETDGWADDVDVVVYNICAAKVTDASYVDRITKVHREGLPAVALHCTMHSHHWQVDTDSWEEFLGVTSPRHGKHHPITVSSETPDHPVMQGFPDGWVTPQGELYHEEKVWPTATVLGYGTIDGGESKHACIWVNEYGDARVFGTTIGHHNETVADDTYLDLVARGLLWATGHLTHDGKPEPGFGSDQ